MNAAALKVYETIRSERHAEKRAPNHAIAVTISTTISTAITPTRRRLDELFAKGKRNKLERRMPSSLQTRVPHPSAALCGSAASQYTRISEKFF